MTSLVLYIGFKLDDLNWGGGGGSSWLREYGGTKGAHVVIEFTISSMRITVRLDILVSLTAIS